MYHNLIIKMQIGGEMSMGRSVLKMYNYHLWANEVILNRLKELPQDIFHKEVKSGFSSVAKVMSHIYLTDLAWLEIISGKSMSDAMVHTDQLKEQLETKNIEEMETSFYELSKRYKELLSSQQDYEKCLRLIIRMLGSWIRRFLKQYYTSSPTEHITVGI